MHDQHLGPILVAQHIYGHLSSAESPDGSEGFQTACYTREALSEGDVAFLEGAIHYQAPPESPEKWQCFCLPSGRHTVTRIVPRREPDSHGRYGRYLAHSLVPTQDDWAHVGATPFSLMSPKLYVSEMSALMSRDPADPLNLPPLALLPQPGWEHYAEQQLSCWEPGMLVALLALVRDRQILFNDRVSVIITGTQKQILNALLVSYLLATPEERLQLSFDTAATGVSWHGMRPPWAVGGNATTGVGPAVIDAAHCLVSLPPDWIVGADPLLRWVPSALARAGVAGLHDGRQQVEALVGLLRGPVEHPPLATPESPVFVEFANANSEAVNAALGARFMSGLSAELQRDLYAIAGSTPAERLAWLARADEGEVAAALYQLILKTGARAANTATLSQITPDHPELLALVAFLVESPESLARALAAIEAAPYEHLLRDLEPHLSPERLPSLLSPRHPGLWLAWVARKLSPANQAALAWLVAAALGRPGAVEDWQALWAPEQVPPADTLALMRACGQVIESLGLGGGAAKPSLWGWMGRRRDSGGS